MAHFAKLDKNNIVIDVVVVNNEELLDNGIESEEKGIVFLTIWSKGHYKWRQTSYNESSNTPYAGIGYAYDEVLNVFISPKPYPSWILNNKYQWEAPILAPIDSISYGWNEIRQIWETT